MLITYRTAATFAAALLPIALAVAAPQHDHEHPLPPNTPDWVAAELDCYKHLCGKGQMLALRYLAEQNVDERDPIGNALMRETYFDTDVLHNDLEIEIFPENASNPDAVHLAGVNRITVESKVKGLTEFTFRLREQYAITAASINGTPIQVATESVSTRVATLDRPYNTGEIFTLTIGYEGPHVGLGFGSIIFGLHTNPDGPPTYAVYTLSQPYYAYTWWPCKDGDVELPGDNIDKATLEIAIITPDNLRAVANGLLVEEHPVFPNRYRYKWQHNYPIATYLVTFAATNYNTWTVDYVHDAGTMPVEFNIYPSADSPEHRADWENAVDMLAAFGDVYGPYPFLEEKYGIYQFGFGGGMEHQTNTGQGGFSQWLTAHELGHQWWGDAITCRTWHDIWLNEGLATYSEAIWAERQPGSSGEPALHAAMQQRRPNGSWDLSVYVYDTTDMGRIFNYATTYAKAAWVFHMLRGVVGDDMFWNILAEYRDLFEGSAATTEDFRAVVEAVTQQNFSWFFEQWVYGIGAPVYLSGWTTTEINGSHYLRLRIQQLESYLLAFGRFEMPIEIEIETTAGLERVTVWHDEDDEYFTLPVSAAPLSVTLDPDRWILHATGPGATSPGTPPPVLVAATPAPEAVVALADAPTIITLDFIESIVLSSGAIALTDSSGDPVPFTIQQAGSRLTLNLTAPLPPGRYTLTLTDQLTNAVGEPLDGEIFAATLPSGEGIAGGNAVFAFSVGCRSDLSANGLVGPEDLNLLLSAWATTDPLADLNADGLINAADLNVLLSEWGNCN